MRYDYYAPLREANDLIVKFNIDTGVIDPTDTYAWGWDELARIESALAGDGPRPLLWATGLGAASSS